jgi:hypothetical protein
MLVPFLITLTRTEVIFPFSLFLVLANLIFFLLDFIPTFSPSRSLCNEMIKS